MYYWPSSVEWTALFMRQLCISTEIIFNRTKFLENLQTTCQFGGKVNFLLLLTYCSIALHFRISHCTSLYTSWNTEVNLRKTESTSCLGKNSSNPLRSLTASLFSTAALRHIPPFFAFEISNHIGSSLSFVRNYYTISSKNGSLKTLLFILCILLCRLTTCESIKLTQSNQRSMKGSRYNFQRQVNELNPNTPRVYMPPLDLGFRGLTSANDHEAMDGSAHNLAQNYQSDESENKPSLIKQPRLPMASKQVAHNLFLSGRQNPTASESTTYNLLGKTHIPSGFQSSLYANREEGNSQYNWDPQNVYAPREFRPLHETFRNAPQYDAGDRQNSYESSINNFRRKDLTFGGKPNTPYKNPYAQWQANQYGKSRQTFDWNTNVYQTDERKPAPVSQSAWYDANQPWNGEHTGWMDPLDSMEHSSELSQVHMETLAVGHPSNYQEITEEEVRRRMQEYNKDILANSNLNLPALPSLPGQNSNPQTTRHLGTSQRNTGLLLVGSKEHDKTVRNFQSLASEWSLTGVETLFDEIDTNRDGMIKIEELRNFLWLHEVAVPN